MAWHAYKYSDYVLKIALIYQNIIDSLPLSSILAGNKFAVLCCKVSGKVLGISSYVMQKVTNRNTTSTRVVIGQKKIVP